MFLRLFVEVITIVHVILNSKDHMLDCHSCQICYPLEIRLFFILLLLLLCVFFFKFLFFSCVFSRPLSIGEERAYLGAFRKFVRFELV